MSVETITKRTEVIAVLEEVITTEHPRFELPAIAARHDMKLGDLQGLLGMNGYPSKDRMAAAVDRLRTQQNTEPEPPAPGPKPVPARFEDREDLPDLDQDYDDARSGPTGPAAEGNRPIPQLDPDQVAGELRVVPVSDLHPDPENPRTELKNIDDLAASIQAAGLQQPIVARDVDGRLVIKMGHRRHAAVQLLGWDTVEVIVRPNTQPDGVLADMLIENGQRVDLDPLEEARALNTLIIRWDCSEKAVAARIGRNLGFVNGRRLLLKLSLDDQDAVRAGRLGVTAVIKKARIDSGRTRPGAVGRPASGHLSIAHPLAQHVQIRCTTLRHTLGRGTGVGGVGCGACWEYVIRTDERQSIHDYSARTGTCGICQATYEKEHTHR